MKKSVIVFSIVLLYTSLCFSEAVIYLKSNIDPKSTITIEDVAIVDGNESELIKNIQIPESVLKDGFITKNEIYTLVKNAINGIIVIHGNAVRINREQYNFSNINIISNIEKTFNQSQITKGESVTVRIIKKSIVIEIVGKALQSGKLGDEIPIALANGKIIYCKIVHDGAECYL